MAFVGTILCDACGQNHILEVEMDMPPNWFGVRIVFADDEGIISGDENSELFHFCTQDCLVQFMKSDSLKEIAILNNYDPDDISDEDGDDPPNMTEPSGGDSNNDNS